MKVQNIKNDYVNSRKQNSMNVPHPNFKRAWTEHISWGANYIKDTGKTNFKLFSFPDAKAVFVEVANKTAVGLQNVKDRIVQVLAFASSAVAIQNIMPKDENSKVYKMENQGEGVFTVNNVDASPEDKYRYIIVTKDNKINLVKDPYAKQQDNIHGWSSIYDSNNYKWTNTAWLSGRDPRRITRNPNDDKYHGLAKLRIEEINIPTVTEEGTFISAKKAVDSIAEAGVMNAIEIMPVENTYSKQWGYDGVDKFAVNSKLGTHAELKELIDYAHGKGLNVIMDMVPNHMGQDGDYLSQTGPYEAGSTQWGAKLNYEFDNNKYVRDWMTNAVLWWANEFKVDGIRLDMTKETASDYLLKQIVDEVNEHNPNIFLIAEDGRDNKLSVTRYDVENKQEHEDKIKSTDMLVDLVRQGIRNTPHFIGFDSEWDFPFMHALKDAVTHNNQTSIGLIDETMKNSLHRIKYVVSHDELGNNDGTRLIPKILAQYLNFFGNIDGYSESDRGQKAAHLSHEISVALISNKDITDDELRSIQEKYGMRHIYDKNALTNAVNAALAKYRLAIGSVMTVPGPKMFFQSDALADLSYFKFFRDFSPEFDNYPPNFGIKEKVDSEKGYNTSNEFALKDSIVGQIKPGGEYEKLQEQMLDYTRDLIRLIDANPALQDGELKSVYRDHDNLVHIHSVEKGDNKLLIFKNFADVFHQGTYFSFGFPQGEEYIEMFCSDDEKYGGGGNNNRGRRITADNQNLNLAANSIIVLQKVK